MKRCPECRRDYYDDSLLYCLDDGNALLEGPASGSKPPALAGGQFGDEPQTAILHSTASPGEAPTRAQINTTDQTAILQTGAEAEPQKPLAGSAEKHSVSARRAKPLAVVIVAAIVLISGFFVYRYIAATKQIESIAVMPFVNESGNADVEYLSDGMTETLISSLSNIPNLSVKARSTVFYYKGKETSAKKIGEELKVQAVLFGRVSQRGDDLKLSLELVNTETQDVIWSEQYSRKQSDVVSLQSDIARDVSNKLKSKLSSADVAKVGKNSNVNPEAYQLYLKGLFQLNRRTGESIRQAADLLKQAIKKDPNYAPAYVALGKTLLLFPVWSLEQPKVSFPQAKAAAVRALELDDSLGDAHAILGRYLTVIEWDRVGSEKEIRRAIELEPNNPYAYSQLADILIFQKRFDEAIAAARREIELDPLSKRNSLANALFGARRFDEVIAEMKEVQALDPTYADNYWNLGWAYFGKGSYREAVATLQKLVELDDDVTNKSFLALALAKAGSRDEAVKQLDLLKQESSKRYVSGHAFALVYLALGNKGEALTWLEKEVEDRSTYANFYPIDPLLEDVREEPRFKAILKRMNLPE